jgi:microcystin-dependent protein
MQPYVGQILAVGFNFAPVGWLQCNGQLVPISEYEVLFTLIGTTYGGDGQTTFGIPDLRGRAALCAGNGAVLGQIGGAETVSLTANQIGLHNHGAAASSNPATQTTPTGSSVLGVPPSGIPVSVYQPGPANTTLAQSTIGPSANGGQPHDNIQPYLVINYIIAPFGVYPSQQ